MAEKQPGYEFGASIGVAKYPQDGTVYEELFRIADGCLYIAKEKGKNRYIIYDEKLHGKAIAEGIKNGHIIGGDFMKPYQKGNMTADMIARIVKDGRNAIDSVFTELMDKMHIQGICVMPVMTWHVSRSMANMEITRNMPHLWEMRNIFLI